MARDPDRPMNPDHTRQGDNAERATPDSAGSFLGEAPREMLHLPVIRVSLSAMVGATLVYSITGAMGIDDTLSPAQRLVFGGLCAVMCWPIFHSTVATVLHLVRRMRTYQVLTIWAASILFIALPCAAVGYTVIGLFGLRDAPFPRIYLHFGAGLAACSAVMMYAATLRAKLRYSAEPAFGVARPPKGSTSADSLTAPTPSPATAVAPPDGDNGDERSDAANHGAAARPARFLERLPERLGRDVIYLNVNGHYVNTVTTEGSGVILMRFSDAVAELGDRGIQVHRSYWVAHAHVTGVFRRDERTFVRVTGGHEVPVSRSHLAAVRELMTRNTRGNQPGLPRILTTSD